MKKSFLMAGIVCATISGSLTNVNAAPFAMPPYYNVPNDNKYPFYGDMNPTPEAAAQISLARDNASFGPTYPYKPRSILDHLAPLNAGISPYYDGLWTLHRRVNYYDAQWNCLGYSDPMVGNSVRRWLVCDARISINGDPISSGYAKENFPNSQCPDTTPRPEKCPWCPTPTTENPVNIPFGFKLLKEVDQAPQYTGGVEFRRYYTSLGYGNEFIVPVRGLGKLIL